MRGRAAPAATNAGVDGEQDRMQALSNRISTVTGTCEDLSALPFYQTLASELERWSRSRSDRVRPGTDCGAAYGDSGPGPVLHVWESGRAP